MTEIKIEKGIPLPPRPRKGGRPVNSVFRQMEIGDSVFMDKPTARAAGGYYGRVARETGWKFTARTVEGGVRVWRIA